MPYSWLTKLMPIKTFASEHILPYQLRPVHDKMNINQRFFKGSCLISLYLTGLFLIGHMEVRHSLLCYGLLVLGIVHMANIISIITCLVSGMIKKQNSLVNRLANGLAQFH